MDSECWIYILKINLADLKEKDKMKKIPKLYDTVYDRKTNKIGTIVYIFEADLSKNIPESYLFEPSDWSYDPEERYDYELEIFE